MKKALVTKNQVAKVKKVKVEVIEEANWANPQGFNPHPTRNMGQGQNQIVLINDPMSAAHVVQQIIQEVFNKDAMEAQFIMQSAHYNGRALCFNADYNDCMDLMQKIEQMKLRAITQGCPKKHIEGLTFIMTGVGALTGEAREVAPQVLQIQALKVA